MSFLDKIRSAFGLSPKKKETEGGEDAAPKDVPQGEAPKNVEGAEETTPGGQQPEKSANVIDKNSNSNAQPSTEEAETEGLGGSADPNKNTGHGWIFYTLLLLFIVFIIVFIVWLVKRMRKRSSQNAQESHRGL